MAILLDWFKNSAARNVKKLFKTANAGYLLSLGGIHCVKAKFLHSRLVSIAATQANFAPLHAGVV